MKPALSRTPLHRSHMHARLAMWLRHARVFAVLAGMGSCFLSAALALEPPDYALKPRSLAPGVFVIEGEVADFSRVNGCNIINTGWIQTPEGTWVINTGPSFLYGQQQRNAIAQRNGAGPMRVLNLNLHPDYFFGNQAWSDVPSFALKGSIEGMHREGGAYADNLYTLCGDWMKDTVSTPAREPIDPGRHAAGRLELLRLSGHTSDDLVLIDHQTGVVFAGGLVFVERIPTTPHANVAQWLQSLDALEQRLQTMPRVTLVPSHGHVYADLRGIAQTRDYLHWLSDTLERSAAAGMDIAEVLLTPLPIRFAHWGAGRAEFARNVTHLYPGIERKHLQGLAKKP